MNKRGIKIALIFLILLIVSSFVAHAQQEVRITEMINKIGIFFFEDFLKMGDYGFKFLIWVALFALMHFGLKKANFDNKIAGVLAFVLALATVILIPNNAITKIFKLYSYLVIIALGVFVPLILFWVVHKKFDEDTAGDAFIRAALYFTIGGALLWFVANVNALMGGFPG